ncbi:MAG: hypothetical protein JWM74_5736 [Myxococcaceae bacterium]|nr:hypothetical protein [Myxococcaceae bacterium]
MRIRPSYAVLTALSGAIAIAMGAVAAVVAPGCTVLTNDALPDDAATFEGGDGAAPSAACTSCVAQECTGAWSVCLTDSRCVALRGCNTPLGESQAAREQCFCDSADASAATPDGGADPLAAYAAFAACTDARTCGKCATDCASTCANGAAKTTAGSCAEPSEAGADPDASADAGDAGSDEAGDAGAPDAAVTPDLPSADGCATCVTDKCNDAKKACALGTECSAFLACAYGCADATCVDACGKTHSTGKASATELSSCTLTSCRAACGY